jgi:hypothetical protein
MAWIQRRGERGGIAALEPVFEENWVLWQEAKRIFVCGIRIKHHSDAMQMALTAALD